MPTFPITYNESAPSGQSPNVRANIDVSTGAGEIGRAVSQFGGAMFEIGQKIAEIFVRFAVRVPDAPG